MRPPPERKQLSPDDPIKAILGLVILLTLAYLGGNPRVVRLEQRLRISQVITAGFPFVLFGLIAHMDSVGILSDPILQEIRPLMPIGLGWIGFTIGFRFDLRRLENLPEGVGTALVLTTILPFLAVVGVTSLLFGMIGGVGDATFLRDALLLATAGAMTARTVLALATAIGAESRVGDRVTRIIKLEEVIAFVGLILVAAFFRPPEALAGWRLPSVGWIFVTLGVGTILGGLVFALMRTVHGTDGGGARVSGLGRGLAPRATGSRLGQGQGACTPANRHSGQSCSLSGTRSRPCGRRWRRWLRSATARSS